MTTPRQPDPAIAAPQPREMMRPLACTCCGEDLVVVCPKGCATKYVDAAFARPKVERQPLPVRPPVPAVRRCNFEGCGVELEYSGNGRPPTRCGAHPYSGTKSRQRAKEAGA